MAESEVRLPEMYNAFTGAQGSLDRPTWLDTAAQMGGAPTLLQTTECGRSLAAEAQRMQHLAQQRLGASASVPSFEDFLATRPRPIVALAQPFPFQPVAHASAPPPSSPEQAGSSESASPVMTPSTPLRSAPSSPLHSPAEPAEPPAKLSAEPLAESPVELAVKAPAEPPAEPPTEPLIWQHAAPPQPAAALPEAQQQQATQQQAAAKAARLEASEWVREASERLQEATVQAAAAFKAREVSEEAAAKAAAAAESAAAAAGAAAAAVASAAAAAQAAAAAVAKADALERAITDGGEGGSGEAAGPSEVSEAAEAPDDYVCPITAASMADPLSTMDAMSTMGAQPLAEPPVEAAAETPVELFAVRVRVRGLSARPPAKLPPEPPAIVTTRHRHRQCLAVLEPWAQHAKVEPGMEQPGLQQPDLQQPDLQQPDLQQPGLQQPDLQQPGLQQPDLQQPDLQQPGLQQPDLQPRTAPPRAPPRAPRLRKGPPPPVSRVSERPPRRNTQPEQIMTRGFLECQGLLPAPLCSRLASLPMEAAEGISNSFQLTPPPRLAEDVRARLLASSDITSAVEATFGTRSFKITTLKVLMTELGAEPQIPHADDFCNRELFGVVHLRAGQAATECAAYDATVAYPTGVWVQCEACEAWFPLPDWVARRREHLVEGQAFTCTRAGRECAAGCGWDDKRDTFAEEVPCLAAVARRLRAAARARNPATLQPGNPMQPHATPGARRLHAAARAAAAARRAHGAVRRAPRRGRRTARPPHPCAPRPRLRRA